jgi:hypothetical protein
MHPEPNAGFFGFLSYSPCPREIQIAPFAYNEAGSNLVPLAGASAPATGQPPPSCVATCQTPAGDVAPLPTIDAVYSTFEGRWLICEGLAGWQGVGAPSDVVGVEFGPASAAPTANGSTGGGKMYYLVQQSGKLVRGAGGAYQLTYDVSPEGPSYQLNMHPTPNSAFGTSFRYSPCPRELELNGWADRARSSFPFRRHDRDGEVEELARVAPLVVVPGHELHEGRVELQARLGVEDRRA